MAATATSADEGYEAPTEAAHHPSDSRYWVIAGILAVVTAVEVAISYIGWSSDTIEGVLLLIGMAIKFFLVGAFFMHLKFDNAVLRRLFISGLVLAVFCYVAMLFMFRQFDTDSKQQIELRETGVIEKQERPT